MTSLSVAVGVLFVVAAVSAHHSSSDPSCDFTGFSGEEAVSRFLAKMPKEANVGKQQFRTIFPGFEVGGLQVRGLQRLRQFGPAIPYCVNGSRQLQVDLINDGRIFFSVPWKTCSGKEGSIMLSAGVSRFTLQFGLVESVSGSAEVSLRLRDYAPSATEEIFVAVKGFDDRAIAPVTMILSKIFDGVLREAWNVVFNQEVLGILKEYSTQ